MSDRKSLNKTMLTGAAFTALQAGVDIACEHFTEVVIYIDVTTVTGTSPTLDIDIEVSHDGTTWHKHSDVTQITAAGVQNAVKLTNIGSHIRIYLPAPGGTDTPTFTLADVVGTFKT